jgi:hypothetical protein
MQPMTTPPGDHFSELLHHYSRRDTNAIYEIIVELANRPDFPEIIEQLTGCRKSATHARDLVDITRALTQRIEAQIVAKRKQSKVFESYYGIAETLKVKLNTKVSEIYLETIFPNELVEEARRQLQNDTLVTVLQPLPVKAVDRYKKELIRIEKGRRALIYTLEKHSNFPIKSAVALIQTLSRLHQRLRSNYYGYLSLKPAFLEIVSIGGNSNMDFDTVARSLTEGTYPVLHQYYTTGVEPSLLGQLELRFAIARLTARIKERNALPAEELSEFEERLSSIWSHKGQSGLGVYGHSILLDTLRQVSLDKQALSKALAKTLVEEYCTAEKQMTLIHMHIVRQLAFTSEFLKHFDFGESDLEDSAEKEKARVAQDKLIGLDGVFDLTAAIDRARSCSLMELERVALGIPTNVGSSQIVEWLGIYGVIFANSDFLKYAQKTVDFSTMRRLISQLSTYHLIQNLAFLRGVVEKGLAIPEDEKSARFQTFKEVIRLKLQGLMSGNRVSEKSLAEMIEELGFIDNKQVQFLIAETFKGFQSLADAFENTTRDYFVNDRQALLKESRDLYNEVCNQCMKNFVHIKPRLATSVPPKKRAPWFRRLFS